MASNQRAKEERAEGAARYAADELKDVRERRELEEERDRMVHVKDSNEERPGVIGSLLKSVQGTLEHAKEAVVGKGSDTGDTARQKFGEYDEYTSRKADETKV